MSGGLLSRIEERLRVVGLSASAASTAAGLSVDAIRNIRRASRDSADVGVSSRTLEALAPVLGTSVAWLLAGDVELKRPNTENVVPLYEGGDLAILLSADHDCISANSKNAKTFVKSIFGADVFAYIVNDNSMNHFLPIGSLIHVNYKDKYLVDDGFYMIFCESCFSVRRFSKRPDRFRPQSTELGHREYFDVDRVDVVGRVMGGVLNFS